MQIGIFINYYAYHFLTILSILKSQENKAVLTEHSIDGNTQITELIMYTKPDLHMFEMKTRQTTVGSPMILINDQHECIKSDLKQNS